MLADPLKESQLVFKGVRFDVHQKTVLSKSGKPLKKEFVVHPGAVLILPVLNEKECLLIQNRRFAVNETLWELPAGTLEPHEKPEETAYRELIEETGYKAKKLKYLTAFYTSPGISNELMHAYAAFDLVEGPQKLEDGEEILVKKVSFKEAFRMIENGEIKDGKTIAALLFYLSSIKTLNPS